MLVPFKKGHWPHVLRIIEETKLPTVVLATLGVLLIDHIRQLHRKPGVYLISAMDDFAAVEQGMRMLRTAHRMRESLLVNLAGAKPGEVEVPHLGTRVRTVPLERFYAVFKATETTDAVRKLAASYLKGAKESVEPTEADVVDAARAYVALKQILDAEGADALMMDCLPGLQHPHKHVPPCMGFMTLRDEGIPAGCQADLNATLSMMLVQELFGLPGFQQNASAETEANHYFGAHCTSPSKMNGPDAPAEPMILRTHAEAGWGCVPQVLFPEGQEVTMTSYLSGENPQMLIYGGKVVRCYPKAPGGCRTNIEMTINEVADACDTQGHAPGHLLRQPRPGAADVLPALRHRGGKLTFGRPSLLDHRQRGFDVAERGGDLDAGDAVADAGDRFAGDFDAHGQLALAAFDRRHALHHGVGHDHARHFVPHERRVAIADQRPDAGDDRNAVAAATSIEKSQQGVGIENRLGDGELRARFDLAAEAVQFALRSSAVGSRPTPITAKVCGSMAWPPRSRPRFSRRCTAAMPIESASNTPVACG